MAASDRLGVLLITGARTHQENYARGFAADSRCRLVGLTDEPDLPALRERLNRQLADALSIPYLPHLNQALSRPDVHIVSVCAEPERRARLGVLAAQAGKHVYMDKPLATKVTDADALTRAVRAAGVRGQMFSLMHAAWGVRAKQAAAADQIGDLTGLHCDLLFAKGPAGRAPLGRPRKESYPPPRFTFVDSKREMFTTAVYSLVLIRNLTGRAVRSVRCVTANYFFAEHVKNDVEDFAALSMTLDGGIVASITAGRIGWQSHSAGGPMRVVLVGSRGSVLVDAYRPRAEISSDAPPWTAPPRNPDDPMGFWSSTRAAAGENPKRSWFMPPSAETSSDQSHFVDAVLGGFESDVTIADGAAAVEVLMAAYKSAAFRKVVKLPLPRA